MNDTKYENSPLRIAKGQILNAIKEGGQVFACASNLSPYYGGGVFRRHLDSEAFNALQADSARSRLDSWELHFKWYNCTDSETGTGVAYYVY